METVDEINIMVIMKLTSESGLWGCTIWSTRFCDTNKAFESPTHPTTNFRSVGRYRAHKAVVPDINFCLEKKANKHKN